jgi:hypothetical protein
VTTEETALFARHIRLLDTQSNANVVSAAELLTSIRRTTNGIVLNGVDKESKGISVDMVGELGEIGIVFYSPKASANILSFLIEFDQETQRFTLRPKGSKNIYRFCRQDVSGSAGRFYECDTRTMIGPEPTVHDERALITTESDNMQKYTHREVDAARKARELLVRMIVK